MLRKNRYIIIGLIVSAIVFTQYKKYKDEASLFLKRYTASKEILIDPGRCKTSRAYILKEGKWLDFPLPTAGTRLKIISNASIHSSHDARLNEQWHYALQYRILDKNKNLLLNRTYNINAQITKYIDYTMEKEIFPAFYLDSPLVPSNPQIINIDLSSMQSGKKSIQFCMNIKDPAIQETLLRIYVQEQVSDYKAGKRWARMSKQLKERLSRGNVFDHEYLKPREKKNLLSKQWHSLGPLGVRGKDYEERTIYVISELEGEEAGIPILPSGMFVKRGHFGIIPVPNEGTNIRIEFQQAFAGVPHEEESKINIHWYGRGVTDRTEKVLDWPSENVFTEGHYEGGLLEISASQDVVIKVFQIKDNKKTPFTPEPIYIRSFESQPERPIIFTVQHKEKTSTPMKIALRHIIPEDGKTEEETLEYVTYHLLDKSGNILKTGELLLQDTVSKYDYISGKHQEFDISDPSLFYFSLPPDVEEIRLSSEKPVLVTGYVRPAELLREIRVPEDYLASTPLEEKQPVWFPLRPNDYDQYIMQGRSSVIALQKRPSEISEEIQQGHFAWEPVRPAGNWLAHHLLVPKKTGSVIRTSAAPVTYHEIEVGQQFHTAFTPLPGMKNIEPTLLFLREETKPSRFHFMMDRNTFYTEEIAGSQGEIRLPAIPSLHERDLQITTTDNTRFFLNYLDAPHNNYLKRLAYKIGTKPLLFFYNKVTTEKETLSAVFYAPYGTTKESILRVHIDTQHNVLSTVTSQTLLNRRYHIKPNNIVPFPVLNAKKKFVDGGQLLFLPLGEDLPPGTYPITFTLEQEGEGYLVLYKVTPGIFDSQTYYITGRVK